MSESLNNSCKILRSSGLRDTEVFPILNEIQKWINSSGEEWTVQHLKKLKLGFVNKLAYGHYRLPEDSWVKHDKIGPSGPFKVLCKIKKPWKALSAFMVYTGFKSKNVTHQQWKKFHDAVNTEPVDPIILRSFSRKIIVEFQKLPIVNNGRLWDLDDVSERSTRIPSWVEGKLKTVPNSFDAIMDNVRAPFISEWMTKRGERIPSFSSMYWRGNRNIPSQYVGTIGMIQEPGFKLRVVANPFPVYQIALSAMGSCLYNALQEIEEDGTFNQEKAIYDIQDYMKAGGSLVAFDLSNATDRFPFQLTLDCLRSVDLNQSDIDLWANVCRSPWKSPFGDITWKTGQPLGVYPSFAAFALSHHAVARSVTEGFYRILGDDIVINKEDAPKLEKLYEALDCKISYDKSIDSENLTEFGGRLIMKDKILSQPKWHDISDRSFIDLARQVGPNILGLLKSRQKKVIKILSEVPVSLHPYGLNWNPKGKPYSQRVEESAWIIDKLGSTPDLLPQASVESKLVSELKVDIQKRSYSKSYNIHINDGENALATIVSAMSKDFFSKRVDSVPNGNNETRILKHIGIDRIEGLNLLPGWLIERIPRPSDPRGIPTLDLIEKKLGIRARKPQSK